MILAIAVAATCLLLVARGGLRRTEKSVSASAQPPSPTPTGPTVGLKVDFGNRVEYAYDAIAWTQGMTVGDVLEAASLTHPSLRFGEVGTGSSALLVELAGIANEGAMGRNWLYSVDGRHAEVGFRVHPVEPGQHILWSFRRGE